MFHLLTILILSAVLFRVFWELGGRELFTSLTRDEVAELERELRDEQDRLDTLPPDDAGDEIALLRTWSRERIRKLRRQLARARGEPIEHAPLSEPARDDVPSGTVH